ncbi:MAG: DUF2493 domain-containing protein [Chloracidobacterium sp.]|nr:DUF2493 domain-containing protein [Chloracidobacterium sp.]
MKMMISGSRTIDSYELLDTAVTESGWEPTEILSGGASGVDTLAEQYAEQHGLPVTVFRPNWALHKRGAGHRRNEEMVIACDVLVALWDGNSRGTAQAVEFARRQGKDVHVKVARP